MKRKLTLQDTMEANAGGNRFYAAAYGKPMPPELEAPVREAKKPRAAPKPSDIPLEHDEQRAFVKWFRTQYPTVLIFAVPNAAMRDYKLAAYLRSEGMTAGVPDLHIPEWKTVIEMKRLKGSATSTEQHWFATYYKRIGWTHFFAYGFDDARNKILVVNSRRCKQPVSFGE